jgi:hypothetical protein
MAPLPTTTTARLVVDYLWRGRPSSVLYRVAPGVSPSDFLAALQTQHEALRPYMLESWAVPGTASWYAAGSTISLPSLLTPIAAGTGGGDSGVAPASLQFEVVGRTLTGRRAAFFHQGLSSGVNAAQRKSVSLDAASNALLTLHTSLGSAGLVAIDGEPIVFKSYVNQVFNDYLTRKARGG